MRAGAPPARGSPPDRASTISTSRPRSSPCTSSSAPGGRLLPGLTLPGVGEEDGMLELKALALTPLALLTLTGGLYAAQAKTYQVTGPVTALTNDVITVQKGKDLWEIGRDSSTKVSGELKSGERVTVQYRLSATEIAVKPVSAKSGQSPSKKK